MRKVLLVLLLLIVVGALIAVATGLYRVEQVQDARLPTLEGGQMPRFEVQSPNVEVGTVNRTVEVPVVDVQRGGEEAPRR